jgi:hypothetical protein
MYHTLCVAGERLSFHLSKSEPFVVPSVIDGYHGHGRVFLTHPPLYRHIIECMPDRIAAMDRRMCGRSDGAGMLVYFMGCILIRHFSVTSLGLLSEDGER